MTWLNRLPDRAIGALIGSGQLLVVVVPTAVFILLLWRRNFRLLGMEILATNVASWTTVFLESRYSDRLGVVETANTLNRGWVASTDFPTSSMIAASAAFVAMSALGAYSLTLPILATFRSQLASSFAALMAPANAGGMALAVRFLQKAGFDTADASSAAGLDAVGGIAAHAVLLFAFVSWTGQTGVGSFALPDASTALLVSAGALVLSGGLMLVGSIRRRVLGPMVGILRSAGGHLGAVFKSPLRVLALFGGSALVTLAYAATLVFSVAAFGGGLTVPKISTAFMVAVTPATFAPTPGGLGALEATMIAALAGFGMDHGPEAGALLTFRLATFWLPILSGLVDVCMVGTQRRIVS